MSTIQLLRGNLFHCYLDIIGTEHHNALVIGSVLVRFKGSMLLPLEPIFFDTVQLSSAS